MFMHFCLGLNSKEHPVSFKNCWLWTRFIFSENEADLGGERRWGWKGTKALVKNKVICSKKKKTWVRQKPSCLLEHTHTQSLSVFDAALTWRKQTGAGFQSNKIKKGSGTSKVFLFLIKLWRTTHWVYFSFKNIYFRWSMEK